MENCRDLLKIMENCGICGRSWKNHRRGWKHHRRSQKTMEGFNHLPCKTAEDYGRSWKTVEIVEDRGKTTEEHGNTTEDRRKPWKVNQLLCRRPLNTTENCRKLVKIMETPWKITETPQKIMENYGRFIIYHEKCRRPQTITENCRKLQEMENCGNCGRSWKNHRRS